MTKLERITGDKITYSFIKNHPKSAKLKNLSDMQGIRPHRAEYYAGEIDHKNVDTCCI